MRNVAALLAVLLVTASPCAAFDRTILSTDRFVRLTGDGATLDAILLDGAQAGQVAIVTAQGDVRVVGLEELPANAAVTESPVRSEPSTGRILLRWGKAEFQKGLFERGRVTKTTFSDRRGDLTLRFVLLEKDGAQHGALSWSLVRDGSLIDSGSAAFRVEPGTESRVPLSARNDGVSLRVSMGAPAS